MSSSTQFIGASSATRVIREEIEYASKSDAKVLITGESGVGKEVVAQLVHQQSRRRNAPLVTINCAGVPDTLLASELVGHMRGSFTDAHRDKPGWLEQANRGTIFLDEVGEMSLSMQSPPAAFSRTARFSVSAPSGSRRRSTCVSLPRPIASWWIALPPTSFAKTCSTG